MKRQAIYNLSSIDKIVDEIYYLMQTNTIITFSGPLGAGKTTLVKKLLTKCGVTESVTSPTYNYVNTYTNDIHKIFYHFDLYRLKTVNEFTDAGFNELLNQRNSFALIEWPEVIEPILHNEPVIAITLDYAHDNQRIITIKTNTDEQYEGERVS